MSTYVSDFEELHQRVADLQVRRSRLLERRTQVESDHAALRAERPRLALAALEDEAATDELASLDTHVREMEQLLSDLNDATALLDSELARAQDALGAEEQRARELANYIAEVAADNARRDSNRAFVHAARQLWRAWSGLESYDAARALHRLHFLAVEGANDQQRNALFGRLAGDLNIGSLPLDGEDMEVL